MERMKLFTALLLVAASIGCGTPFVAFSGDEGSGGAGGGLGAGGSVTTTVSAGGSTVSTSTSATAGGGGSGGSAECVEGSSSCEGEWVVSCENGGLVLDIDCASSGASCAAGKCEFDLVSLLRFEGQTGSTALDESPSDLAGQLIGSSWGVGSIGGGLDCAPAGRVEFGDVLNDLQLPFSIAAWVKVSPEATESMTVVATDTGSVGYGGGWLSVNSGSGNTVTVGFGDGGGSGPSNRNGKTSGSGFPVGVWTHVAGVFEAPDQAKLYINGLEVSGTYSGGATQLNSTSSPYAICRGNWGGLQSQFIGSVDEVRVYARAINQVEMEGW